MTTPAHSKNRVCYYYDHCIGDFFYGLGHEMKPLRIRMTHELLVNYRLLRKMEIIRPPKATAEQMQQFHSKGYIDFLASIKPDNTAQYDEEVMAGFGVGVGVLSDCPVFEGLYEFCQLSAGGSIAAAAKLNKQESDICINWSGGLHHAQMERASGFCYVNDIVLSIKELLKHHQRVLYIDIDVHHGDGVEEAFKTMDRVMTVSFHKYDKKNGFFPNTGAVSDIGVDAGKYYTLNVPLKSGMNDSKYKEIFEPVIQKVMDIYQPSAIVLQCGADSLAGDRVGPFNLTLRGHGDCVKFVKSFGKPLLLLGGGGYTIQNVARCWTYETSLALGVEIANELPYNDYIEDYGPDFELHISPTKEMRNSNTKKDLDKIRDQLLENLTHVAHAPSVQVQSIPEDAMDVESEDEDEVNKDERLPQSVKDKRIAPDNEFSDSEDEGEGGRRNRRSYEGQRKLPRESKSSASEAEVEDEQDTTMETSESETNSE